LSANTVQKYGRAHGWPTQQNRERFYESRYDREERDDREARDDSQWIGRPHPARRRAGEA
jgi:hypothetical protein